MQHVLVRNRPFLHALHQHKQLDPEHRLMAARDATNVLYHDINHQHALEVQLRQQKELEMQRRQQQRILNKDQELER